jgi:hypothetical protein
MLDPAPAHGFSGLAVILRLKRSRGAAAGANARFALALGSGLMEGGGSYAFA